MFAYLVYLKIRLYLACRFVYYAIIILLLSSMFAKRATQPQRDTSGGKFSIKLAVFTLNSEFFFVTLCNLYRF
jgi:hypothetical protein